MTTMTLTTTTINGTQWLVIPLSQLRIPLDWDPNSGMFLAVAGDIATANLPILAKGDTGDTPILDTAVTLNALDPTDPTADSASLTQIATDTYHLNLTLHKGQPGSDGTSELDPTAYGTPAAGDLLIVNPTADGFVYQPQLNGDRYIPAVINSTPAGNANFTLATIAVPPQDFDWRPVCAGQSVITPNSGDVVVDLLVRLNNATAGSIVARGVGTAGIPVDSTGHASGPIPPTGLQNGPPAGSVDTYDKVLAGAGATLYLRTERQAGVGTYTTSAATTTFWMRVQAVP